MHRSIALARRFHSNRNMRPLVEPLESRRLLSVSVTTWHYDLARTGLNSNETQLTPVDVNSASFGKLISYPVDGQLYAQPLYVPNLAIPGKGTHDLVFVATQHNSVYAFDADSNAGPDNGLLWHVNLGNPATTPSPYIGGRYGPWTLVTPYIGIEGTPVIDPSTSTMYLDSFTNDGPGIYAHHIHALDITTGADKVTPTLVAATYPGNGAGGDGTNVPFIANRQQQRPGLTLLNGIVYVAYGSFDDTDPHHGWILGYDAKTLQLVRVFNTTPNLLTPPGPNAGEGPIWQSGAGLSSDGSNLYAMTGNGDFDTHLDANGFPIAAAYADSFIKVSTANSTLALTDYFTPYNQQALTNADNDVGSAGPMVLPDEAGSTAHPHLLVGVGKQGIIWVLDRDNMGKFNPTSDHVLQEVQLGSGAWSNPAYFNGRLYFHGVGGVVKAFSVANGVVSTSPVAQGAISYDYPGATPTMSANGESNGIIWEIQSGGVLHAYNPTTLAELYNSNQAGGRDQLGSYVKFTTPAVADGKVFVGTANSVSIFGLRPQDTITGTPGNDAITLQQDGDHQHIDWTLNGGSVAATFGKFPINDPNGLTITGNGGIDAITLEGANPLPNLLKLSGTFTLNGFTPGTVAVGQTIDLGISTLTIPYSGATLLPAVQKLLQSGYDNGAWDGSGIVSSAAKSDARFGIADTDSANAVQLRYGLIADANADGTVGFPDLLALATHYNSSGADWSRGDFDYNGKVDFNDLLILAQHYGGTLPMNLLQNGDFSLGNTGFTSGYSFNNNLFTETTYTVGTDPSKYHSGVISYGDHTTGSGQMLIVNGAVIPNVTIWQQTVAVTPGTRYDFTGWARSWGGTTQDPSPALLQLQINGQTVGTSFQLPGALDHWAQFNWLWDSVSATTATIRLLDLNTAANGNDFSLDDFSFAVAAPPVPVQPPDAFRRRVRMGSR